MPALSASYTQACRYCHRAFVPVKRGTQRYCSASCRTSYCRKKKAGTLGRLTKLAGPHRPPTVPALAPAPSFLEQVLAAATGALAANALSQTVEYVAVTQDLVQQVAYLRHLLEQVVPPAALSGLGLAPAPPSLPPTRDLPVASPLPAQGTGPEQPPASAVGVSPAPLPPLDWAQFRLDLAESAPPELSFGSLDDLL